MLLSRQHTVFVCVVFGNSDLSESLDITGRVSIDQFSDSTYVEIKTDSDNTGSSTNDEDEDYRSHGDTGSQTDDTKENESNSGVTSLSPFYGVVVMIVFCVLLH